MERIASALGHEGVPELFHSWVGLASLFALITIALLLMGWSHALGARPAERASVLPWSLLLVCYALALLLKHFQEDTWQVLLISGAVLLGGVLSNAVAPRGLWLPAVLLAALLGTGLLLSTLVLIAATVLVLLLSAGRR